MIINLTSNTEREYVRDLAKAYYEYAVSPLMESRRNAWSEHNALNFTRPLIYIRAIPFGEFFDSAQIKCTDSYLRGFESSFLFKKYHSEICDDYIEEPYMTIRASLITNPGIWNMPVRLTSRPVPGGAAAYDPVLNDESDFDKLCVLPHKINEEATKMSYEKLYDLFGNIMPVHVDRQGALCSMWNIDIATTVAKLRGLEQIMWDAYDNSEWFHRVLGFMRDKILQNMDETEAAGDFSYLNHQNQAMPYLRGLERPGGSTASPDKLWGYMAAQEYTTFSPDMFDEFLFAYQKPILERYAVTAYGCCEDLTHKIDIIRKLGNLRRIGVSPFADLKKCAEQIGSDYVLSWRPNPSDMVSHGIDEDYIRKYIRSGIDIMKANNCIYDITLKDVETVSGDPNAIPLWTKIVREEIDRGY